MELTGREDDLKISSVKDELVLPEASRSYGTPGAQQSAYPPPIAEAVTLTGRFDDITFAGPSAITTLSSTFFIQHPNQDKGPLSTIQAKTLRLPEGLETLGARALAAGAYGYFISNQQIDLRTALNIKQLLLPSTLRSIGEAAFFSAQTPRARHAPPAPYAPSVRLASTPAASLRSRFQRAFSASMIRPSPYADRWRPFGLSGRPLRYWDLWLSSVRQSRDALSVSSSQMDASQRTSRQATHRSSSTS